MFLEAENVENGIPQDTQNTEIIVPTNNSSPLPVQINQPHQNNIQDNSQDNHHVFSHNNSSHQNIPIPLSSQDHQPVVMSDLRIIITNATYDELHRFFNYQNQQLQTQNSL